MMKIFSKLLKDENKSDILCLIEKKKREFNKIISNCWEMSRFSY